MWNYTLISLLNDLKYTDWLSAIAYLIPALMSVIYTIRITDIVLPNETFYHKILWWSVTVILVLLSIYRLFDFQLFIADVGRRLALAENWYEQRFIFQLLFVVFIIVIGIIVLSLLESEMANLWRYYWLTICGVVYLTCFTIINTLSYHPIDILFNHYVIGIRISWMLEVAGIFIVVISIIINFNHLSKNTKIDNTVIAARYI